MDQRRLPSQSNHYDHRIPSDDGTYQIAGVTSSTLTLEQVGVLKSETATCAALTGSPTLTFNHIGLTGNPTLTFTHNAGGGDTISRSAGSWTLDGFQAGEQIEISGTGQANNDGTYTIASISADGTTLTLVAGDQLVDEAASGVTVSAHRSFRQHCDQR